MFLLQPLAATHCKYNCFYLMVYLAMSCWLDHYTCIGMARISTSCCMVHDTGQVRFWHSRLFDGLVAMLWWGYNAAAGQMQSLAQQSV